MSLSPTSSSGIGFSRGLTAAAVSPPATDKELLLRSQEEAQRLQRRAGRHQEKRDKIERHNRRLGELLERRTRELQNKLSQLAALRREHILELTSRIFPMQEEKQGSRSARRRSHSHRHKPPHLLASVGFCDHLLPLLLSLRDPADVTTDSDPALTSSTVTELAEARRTTYLSGRWIWDDQNGETSISITGPPVTLPSNGDCSAYYSWVEEKSTNQGPGEENTRDSDKPLNQK